MIRRCVLGPAPAAASPACHQRSGRRVGWRDRRVSSRAIRLSVRSGGQRSDVSRRCARSWQNRRRFAGHRAGNRCPNRGHVDARVEDSTRSGASLAGCPEGGPIEQAPGYMVRQDRIEFQAFSSGRRLTPPGSRPGASSTPTPADQRVHTALSPDPEEARSSASHPISLQRAG